MNARQQARAVALMEEAADALEMAGCQFFACPGAQAAVHVQMATCCCCWSLRGLRRFIARHSASSAQGSAPSVQGSRSTSRDQRRRNSVQRHPNSVTRSGAESAVGGNGLAVKRRASRRGRK